MRYQPVIGLEIHAELLTDSKVFCTCQNEFGGSENTRVCPRCSGLPGTLPLLNQGAVRLAAKAGFALDCTVNNYSALYNRSGDHFSQKSRLNRRFFCVFSSTLQLGRLLFSGGLRDRKAAGA